MHLRFQGLKKVNLPVSPIGCPVVGSNEVGGSAGKFCTVTDRDFEPGDDSDESSHEVSKLIAKSTKIKFFMIYFF